MRYLISYDLHDATREEYALMDRAIEALDGQRIMETLWVVRYVAPQTGGSLGSRRIEEATLTKELAQASTESLVKIIRDYLTNGGSKLLVACLDCAGCWSGHNLTIDPSRI